MMATSETIQEVYTALKESHREWPLSENSDTINGDAWPIAWDAAAFIEEWFKHPDHNDLEEALVHIPLNPENFDYEVASWHSQKNLEPLLRIHLLRIVKQWAGVQAIYDYLLETPELVGMLGLRDGVPSKSTIWRVWNTGRLDDEYKQVIRIIGQVLVNVAREYDVPAPDEVFHPDPGEDAPEDVDQDDETVAKKTIKNTEKVWKKAKPIVTEHYTVPRGQNTEIHNNAFLEAHAYIGAREDMYAEDGVDNYHADTTRSRVQSGSNHRYHMQKIGPDDAREMHHKVTEELIEQARGGGELDGPVLASIDITKSNPYRTRNAIERDEDGNVTNDWILGYKDSQDGDDEDTDFYFQWASIQICGLDIPLVLDAIPVRRGLSRAQIVGSLLKNALNLIDIDLVLMDREFSGDAVQAMCEYYGVYYLTAGKMYSSERATCTEMRRNDEIVRVEDDEPATRSPQIDVDKIPKRKQLYLPAQKPEFTGDEIEDEEDDQDGDSADEEQTEEERREEIHQELRREFARKVGIDLREADRMFGGFVEDMKEQEEKEKEEYGVRGHDADTQLYVLFETNHPMITHPDDDEYDDLDEMERLHEVTRLVRKYKHRWTIENGYKQIKSFRARTTSMKYEYRFFNFLYACTLYNVWRLVDLLVKLELLAESEFRYKPIVTADLFLTIAKKFFGGLDPPD